MTPHVRRGWPAATVEWTCSRQRDVRPVNVRRFAVCIPGRADDADVMANPDLSSIRPGTTGSSEITVAPHHTAPHVGSGRIAVLATPVMINVIEAAALAAIEHLLPDGHQSLGIHLDVSHVAATPVGLRVTATAEVVSVEGRTIVLRVAARDEFETIGTGTHQRVVVNVARFDERVRRKSGTVV